MNLLQEKILYQINDYQKNQLKSVTKISPLSSENIGKYEFFTGEDILPD